jgi:hypothetical protein
MTTIPKPDDPFAIDASTDNAPETPTFDVADVFSGQGDYLKHGDVKIGLIKITPEIATDWLTRYNIHNRNPIAGAIAGHARDMLAGDWLFIGDTIRFSTLPDGRTYIADGQNRLKAIEKSGVPQTYIVVVNLDHDAQTVMDTQRARTFANTLSLDDPEDGEPWTDVNRLGAIIRRTYMYEQYGRVPKGGGTATPTKPELRAYLSVHAARFRRALTVTQAANTAVPKLGKSATMIGAAYFILSNKDQEAADLFFREMLIKGFGLDDEHPVTHLRRRYGSEGLHRVDDDDAFRLTFKTWNHWRKNEKLEKTVQVPRNGWPIDFREYPIF